MEYLVLLFMFSIGGALGGVIIGCCYAVFKYFSEGWFTLIGYTIPAIENGAVFGVVAGLALALLLFIVAGLAD